MVRFFDDVGICVDGKVTNLAEVDEEYFDRLSDAAPFLRRQVDRAPRRPPLVPSTHDTGSVLQYLSTSRKYRLLFPTLDVASKKDRLYPVGDSTRLKFSLGIDLTGCLHVGSGRVTASSVPEAGERVDWMVGTDLFNCDPCGRLIVSDAAIPSADGLGCGQYPGLLRWFESLAGQGYQIIAKVTFEDLLYLSVPYCIVNKPRKHNAEVIITMNIPGVTMDLDWLLEQAVQVNEYRNECCYKSSIPYSEDDVVIDEDLLNDPRDFSHVLANFGNVNDKPIVQDKHRNEYQVDIAELETCLDSGYFDYDEVVNARNINKAEMAMLQFMESKKAVFSGSVEELRSGYLTWRDVEGGRGVSAASFPLKMWADTFPNLGVRQIVSIVRIVDYVKKGWLKYSNRERANLLCQLTRDLKNYE